MTDEEWKVLFERRLLGDHTLLGLIISDVERQEPGYCDRLLGQLDARLGVSMIEGNDQPQTVTAEVRSQVLMQLDRAKQLAAVGKVIVPDRERKLSLKQRFAKWLLS